MWLVAVTLYCTAAALFLIGVSIHSELTNRHHHTPHHH